jgi:N-acetyltransferase
MAQMAEVDRFGHALYSWAQVEQFFDRISLPQKYRDHPALERREATRSKEGGEFLALLHRYTLAAVPFESLELHYSPHRTISLDPQHLFHKIVERGFGRGGYCMETNTLFLIILRTIGYDVYPVGARVSDASEKTIESENWRGPKYSGW